MEGEDYTTIDYKTKIAVIIGNEGKGISRLVSENCDYLAKIPMKGTVNSLNASVACGIFLSEIIIFMAMCALKMSLKRGGKEWNLI